MEGPSGSNVFCVLGGAQSPKVLECGSCVQVLLAPMGCDRSYFRCLPCDPPPPRFPRLRAEGPLGPQSP